MSVVYSAADIAISRAGASVVCELAIHKLASILIPYPYAAGHQVKNAVFFKNKEAAIVIEEHQLSPHVLAETIEKLMKESGLRLAMGGKIGKFAVPDAEKKLADEVESLLWRQ